MQRLVVRVIAGLIQRLGRMARAPADFVQAQIAGDGEEPGGKLGGGFVARGGFPDLDKDILRQVLGFGLVAQRAEGEVHHGLLVFLDQRGESRRDRPA